MYSGEMKLSHPRSRPHAGRTRQRGFAALRHRGLLNLLLLAGAAVLSAALWFDRDTEKPAKPVTDLSRKAITEVTVHYPHAPDLALTKTGDGGWRMTSPVEARVEDSEVQQTLRLAEAEIQRDYPAAEIDPAEVGLDEPAYTVVFSNGNRQERIELGDASALEGNRYARVGDAVYLITEPNIRALDTDYSNLVARKLLPPDAELERIELPQLTLTRADTGGWTVQPEQADRGADAAQATVDAWRTARALWMRPADGSKPQARVRLHMKDGTRELEVVAREPQLILRDPGLDVHYHVAANQAGPLLDMRHPEKRTGKQNKGNGKDTAQTPAPRGTTQ